MLTTLVTGGGGFLGSRIVEMLIARGDRVRVFGRHRYPHLEALGAEGVSGDIRDADAVCGACAGMDLVFHTAALAGVWGRRRDYVSINTDGTANVIRGCIAGGVPYLVHTSSPSVVCGSDDIEGGDESLPYPQRYLAHYPASKAEAERLVLAANGRDLMPVARAPDSVAADTNALWTCALRPHLIWGPRDPHLVPRIVAAARAGKLLQIGAGKNRVDITYIDNAARAHLLAADELMGQGRNAGNVYFIGDAEAVALWDWINTLLRRLDVPPVSRAISYRGACCLGAALELVHGLVPGLGEPRLTRFTAAQLARSHWFSHARAQADFGYAPEVDNATGMDRLVEWLRTRPV